MQAPMHPTYKMLRLYSFFLSVDPSRSQGHSLCSLSLHQPACSRGPNQAQIELVRSSYNCILINLNAKSTGINQPIVSGGPLGCEGETTTVSLPNGEWIDVVSLPWYRMALESLTMYKEISTAHIPEEFVPLHLRFQQEWIFIEGFVSRSTIMFYFGLPANSSFDV